ncbi:MAG: rhodanese-like domain-containing protein [Chromatiaceae bacterium]|nr:rhodanese-like domain-containing protein [Chromatiaceae bacterium]
MQPQQLIEFIGNHWMLFAALAAIVALLVHNFLVSGKGSLDPVGATDLINHKDALVLDVRPVADFEQGHIINAHNIPMNGFKKQIGTLQKHKDRHILVTCRSGSQSSMACQQLRKDGFGDVYNLRGGVLAWQSANLPLSKKKTKR